MGLASLLEFLNLRFLFGFNDFGEMLARYFFQHFFCPISFLSHGIPVTHILGFGVLSHTSLKLYLFFQIFCFFFRSDNFCWPILKFSWPYFVIANLWLSPFSGLVFFKFQISYYLFLEFPFGSPFIVSVFLQDFPLCSLIFNRFYFISLSIIII